MPDRKTAFALLFMIICGVAFITFLSARRPAATNDQLRALDDFQEHIVQYVDLVRRRIEISEARSVLFCVQAHIEYRVSRIRAVSDKYPKQFELLTAELSKVSRAIARLDADYHNSQVNFAIWLSEYRSLLKRLSLPLPNGPHRARYDQLRAMQHHAESLTSEHGNVLVGRILSLRAARRDNSMDPRTWLSSLCGDDAVANTKLGGLAKDMDIQYASIQAAGVGGKVAGEVAREATGVLIEKALEKALEDVGVATSVAGKAANAAGIVAGLLETTDTVSEEVEQMQLREHLQEQARREQAEREQAQHWESIERAIERHNNKDIFDRQIETREIEIAEKRAGIA